MVSCNYDITEQQSYWKKYEPGLSRPLDKEGMDIWPTNQNKFWGKVTKYSQTKKELYV